MKTLIISICSIFLFPLWAVAGDWRLSYFDAAQELAVQHELKEVEYITTLAPASSEFYDVWLPLQEIGRQIDRYFFLLKLQSDPQSITMENPYNWRQQNSSQEVEDLAKHDKEFSKVYDEFLARREAYRNAVSIIKKHKAVMAKHEAKIYKIDMQAHEKLMRLQEEVSAKMANQSQESGRGSSGASR